MACPNRTPRNVRLQDCDQCSGCDKPKPAPTPPFPSLFTDQYYYQDDPGAVGPGTYAQSYAILVPTGTIGRLSKLTVRIDFPASVGESSIIRLYLYHKPSPFGPFSYTQITSTFVVDDTSPWSWTQDITANILPGFDLDPVTDSIAISNVYSNGGPASMRALRVDFQVDVVPPLAVVPFAAPPPSPSTWPVP